MDLVSTMEKEKKALYCLYCYNETEYDEEDKIWLCVNEMCALYMKDQFHGETHD